MRHNSRCLCDIIIRALLCINMVSLSSAALSQDPKGVGAKGKTGIIKKTEKGVKPKTGKVKKEDENLTKLTGKDYKEEDFRPVVEEESYGWLVFKTILILGVLVGCFYYFLRFVTKKAGIQVLGKEAVQILSMVPVGQNKYLQIVDIAGRIFVLGVSDNNINLITEIEGKNDIDRIRLLSTKSTPVKGNRFGDFLSRHIGNMLGRADEKKAGSSAKFEKGNYSDSEFDMDYLQKQKKRLKNLNGFGDE